MEFLDKFVIIQSGDNLNLLYYILILAYIILIPFISLTSGASLLSLVYNRKGRKTNNEKYLKFSRDLIGVALFSKTTIFSFAVMPVISILFSYVQLFHHLNFAISGWTFFAFILITTGLILLYLYKYTFKLDSLIGSVANSSELDRFKQSNFRLHYKTGWWGVVFIYLALYILTGCIEYSYGKVHLDQNESFLTSLFTMSILIKFLLFVVLSFALTSAGILFFYFILKKESTDYSSEYLAFAQKHSLTIGIISVIALPLIVVSHLLFLPYFALTSTAFSISLIVILLLLLSAHYYYVMIKENRTVYVNNVLFIIIIVAALIIIQDQGAFKTSSQKQVVTLSAEYDKMLAGIAEKNGKTAPINGKDIFDGRCSACHRFDQKLVGPAYKDVLPKYEGKSEQLVNFILNPVKMNPAFPPMPNQGLKQKEAEAIAEYIMQTYKTK